MIAAAVRPNLQAALREARKRWGAKAHVEYREYCAGGEPLRILVRTLYAGLPWPRSLLKVAFMVPRTLRGSWARVSV